MISESTKDALRRLLDDENPTVRGAVLQELRDRDEEGVSFLKEIASDGESGMVRHARSFLAELGADDPVGDFRAFIRSFHYELETGCYLLERTVHPDLEWSVIARFLDAMAERCLEFVDPNAPVFESCKQINRVIYHEYGFQGDLDHFHDPDNNFLGSVIRRRKGIPISLSVIYLLVAERCGVALDPIGAPGRFLLGHLEGRDPFYIDAFDRGRFRTEEEIRQILLTRHIEDGAEYLFPSPVGEVLCRFCRNLVHQYTIRNELGRARLFASFIQEFEDAYERESS